MMHRGLFFGTILLAACGESGTAPDDEEQEPACTVDADCTDAAAPLCNVDAGSCEPLPAGHPIGWRDGSPGSVALVPIYTPSRPLEATDLAFHPDRTNELWVLHRQTPGTCTDPTGASCAQLGGTIVVVFDPGAATQQAQEFQDPNAWHFMRLPPAFAFGDNGNFATCGEERTGNFLDDPISYMGPTLWTSALPGIVPGCETSPTGCYSVQPPGKNGSHIDMLHATPWGMGIAHEQANVYWVFNGDIGALDRYDFVNDHGPGNEDHSDGVLRRYAVGQLLRTPAVPSHMKYDAADAGLYVADTGNGRVAKLDTASGTPGGPATPNFDTIDALMVDGATLVDVVAPGVVVAPSGLWIHDDILYVTDNATSRIHAFSKAGEALRSLDTGLPPGSLAGITIGHDGKAYFVEKPTGAVFRIDPM